MRKFLLVLVIIIAGCVSYEADFDGDVSGNVSFDVSVGGFCGMSTYGACVGNEDCVPDGCSGQICRSASEESIVTTCEYLECYDETAYGISCGCVQGQCQWA